MNAVIVNFIKSHLFRAKE